MTKTTYTAFGVLRTSEANYTHAAKHCVGITFHKSEQAARATGGMVARVSIATAADIAAAKAAKAAVKAERAARQADFDRRFAELGGT